MSGEVEKVGKEMLGNKNQVLRVYPYAICEQETKPGTRITGFYAVKIQPGGPRIALGKTPSLAWAAAITEMRQHELKPRN